MKNVFEEECDQIGQYQLVDDTVGMVRRNIFLSPTKGVENNALARLSAVAI